MLDYKTLGGDLLVFKGKNTLTISRGSLGIPSVDTIEIDGDSFYAWEDDEMDEMGSNPFTEDEIVFFIKNYDHMVGEKY